MLKSLKDRTNLCWIYVKDDEDVRRLNLILNFYPANHPTTNNIVPRHERNRLVIVNGFPMDHVIAGSDVASGKQYTIMTNSIAVSALEHSFVAPARELKEMIDANNKSKNIYIPLSGNQDDFGNTLLNTYSGAVATDDAIKELHYKQDELEKEKVQKSKRKDENDIKKIELKRTLAKVKKLAINYFRKYKDDAMRNSFVNKMFKPEVDLNIKAFDGVLTDRDKKKIKIGSLKEQLINLIIDASDNTAPEVEDDDDDDEDEDNNDIRYDDDDDDDDDRSPPRRRSKNGNDILYDDDDDDDER
jgi:hypothetical protein